MSFWRCLILVGMVAGLPVFGSAQNSASQSSDPTTAADTSRTAPATALSAIAGMEGDGGPGDTASTLPQIPGLLGGIGVSSASLSEMERSNYLRGGINVGAAYDDNPLLLSSGVESNTSESVFPNIKIAETTSRMRWTLGYAGGLTVNQKFTNQNQGSHNLNFDSQYRLTPHLSLHVAENFSVTTGFFDGGNAGDAVLGSGGPNASLITPLANQKFDNTTAELNYHFALNDLVGGSGSFSDSHFSNVAGQTQLANTQTVAASGFWLHQLFAGDWAGAAYRFERITFDPSGESRVHSFYAVDTLNFSKRLSLTGFVGPQYVENQGLIAGAATASQTNEWTTGGGVEFGWRNENTGASVGYSRMISDGGGVLGSVLLQTVHGSLHRQLTRAWTGSLTAQHGTNQSLTVPFQTSARSINLTSVSVSLDRNLGRSIGFRMGYTHDFQQQFGVPGSSSTLDANRNRVFVTLSYQWAKPLGM
jgi:hypothetical protein